MNWFKELFAKPKASPLNIDPEAEIAARTAVVDRYFSEAHEQWQEDFREALFILLQEGDDKLHIDRHLHNALHIADEMLRIREARWGK